MILMDDITNLELYYNIIGTKVLKSSKKFQL